MTSYIEKDIFDRAGFRHALGLLALKRAPSSADCRKAGALQFLDPGSVLTAKLAPDMMPFGEQFAVNRNKVELHWTKLVDRDQATPRMVAMIYPALQGRLLETRGFLQTIEPEELASAQTHTYQLTPSVARGWFGGDDYIRYVVLADFFFPYRGCTRDFAASWSPSRKERLSGACHAI